MKDAEVVLNRLATISFTMTKELLMVMGEEDLGLIPPSLSLIIQDSFLDCLVFLFMVEREGDIGLRPATFLHITMVYYTLST